MANGKRWTKEDVLKVKEELDNGTKGSEMCRLFPSRTYTAVTTFVTAVRKGDYDFLIEEEDKEKDVNISCVMSETVMTDIMRKAANYDVIVEWCTSQASLTYRDELYLNTKISQLIRTMEPAKCQFAYERLLKEKGEENED